MGGRVSRLGLQVKEGAREGSLGLWGFWSQGGRYRDQHVLIMKPLSDSHPGHTAPAQDSCPPPLLPPQAGSGQANLKPIGAMGSEGWEG